MASAAVQFLSPSTILMSLLPYPLQCWATHLADPQLHHVPSTSLWNNCSYPCPSPPWVVSVVCPAFYPCFVNKCAFTCPPPICFELWKLHALCFVCIFMEQLSIHLAGWLWKLWHTFCSLISGQPVHAPCWLIYYWSSRPPLPISSPPHVMSLHHLMHHYSSLQNLGCL